MGQSLGQSAVAMAVLSLYIFAAVVTSLIMFAATVRIGLFLQQGFWGHLVATPWSEPGNATIGVLMVVLTAVIGFGALVIVGLCLRWVFDALLKGPLGLPAGNLWIGMAGLLGVAGLCLLWTLPIWESILPAISGAFASIAPGSERNTLSIVGSTLPLAGLSLWFINSSSITAGLHNQASNSAVTTGGNHENTRSSSSSDEDRSHTERKSPQPSESTSSVDTSNKSHGSRKSANQEANRPSSQPVNSNTQPTDPATQFNSGEFEYDWRLSNDVSMDDVGGMEDVKQSLHRKVIAQLKSPELRESAARLDISLPNLMLHGPPGTGKTYLAMALATEIGLPFVKVTGGDITTKWINESSSKVNTLFSEARKIAAMEGGAVVFLDEMDAVLSKRGGSGNHRENQKVVDEFLGHLDNTTENNIFFIGATNRPDDIDPAISRAGRIDEKVEVPEPDTEARKAIFKAQLQNRPHDLTNQELDELADKTDGLVAADIEAIVDEAARILLFDGGDREQLQWVDLKTALDSEDW